MRYYYQFAITGLLVTMLVLAAPLGYAGAQEVHEHSDHAATSSGPSVADDSLSVEEVAEGLMLPTTMAFLDEDTILVLEKDNGTVRMVQDGELQDEPLLDVAVANDNERGMLGIAVSDNSTAGTTYVFLYFTESGGGEDGDDREGVAPAGNRLYRYELQGDQLENPELLLDLPALPGPRYNGGPILIGPDGFVYIIIGDVEGHTTQAQNFEDGPATDGTSGVLRVGQDGEIPPSVIGTGVFGKYYYAYGIRNSFGMAFDPVTDTLWDTENGPAFGDEVNLVDPGFNSGWRDVQGIANQTDLGDLVLFNARSHYSDPKFSWTEPVGPTALAFLDSDELGDEYENDLFVGDINNGALYRFELNDNRSELVLDGALADTVADTPEESQDAIFGTGFGGITDIKTGPDGYLYVTSFIEGVIYRIAPDGASNNNNDDDDEDDDNGNEVDRDEATDSTPDSMTAIIEQFAQMRAGDDGCFDEDDERRLDNALAKIIEDIFGENQQNLDRLDREIDRIVDDCVDRDDNDDNEGQGNNNRGRGNDNNDEEEDDD